MRMRACVTWNLSTGFECVLPPVYRRRVGAAGDREHVEAACGARQARVIGEERAGRAYEFRAFRRADRIDAIAETARAAIAHFDEHDDVALAHDEIELAVAAAVIPGDQCEACAFEMRERDALVARAARAAIGR